MYANGIELPSILGLLVVFPVVCDMYESTVDTYSILLGRFEHSGGEAGSFRCVGYGKGRYFLDAEAQLVVVVVCVKCSVNFGNVNFELDLVFLPLMHMDVIFGMDWMLSFGVNINYLTKGITFSKIVYEVGGKFLTAEQVKKFLDGEACCL